MKKRQVYVIEWLNKEGEWETWEVYGTGNTTEWDTDGGMPYYKRRLRAAQRRFSPDKFRLIRYLPEASK